uniref:Uncharacterized protein n=1 Tax=Panagrolaimus sp. ES5 TaxID=591445 RepID=A0AC34EZL4_9BILA
MVFLEINYVCYANPAIDATPKVPALPCTTCADLSLTKAPGATNAPGGFNTGEGSIANSVVGPGCRQYTITCNAIQNGDNRAVVIGANEDLISLSDPGPGEKMSTLVCNDMGEIEGRTDANDPVIVVSAYCSNEN